MFEAIYRENKQWEASVSTLRLCLWEFLDFPLNLIINGRRSPFVRLSSLIRLCSLRLSSRQLYLVLAILELLKQDHDSAKSLSQFGVHLFYQ